MIGLGTIINVGTVLTGTTVGLLLKNGLPKRFERTISQSLGLCTFFIGIGGAVSGLVTIQNGKLATQHTMLLVLCMMLGALIGEALDIERRLNDFGVSPGPMSRSCVPSGRSIIWRALPSMK